MNARVAAVLRFLPDPLLAGCMLLGAIVYAPTVRGEFVWDDVIFVGRWVGSTDTLREILFPPPGVIGTRYYYRPITQGFATLLWALFGGKDPTFWHVAIVLVHLATVACVFVLLREWWLAPASGENRRWAAAAGAAFYACWPANAESVAWISSRADTLLGPFVVGALLLHLRARDRARRPVGAAALFLCSLLVKETGVVFLPLALVCTALMPRGASAPEEAPVRAAYDRDRPWSLALWLPYVLVYFAYSWMRRTSMGAGTGISQIATMLLGNVSPPRVFDAWGFYVQEALSLGPAPPFLHHPPPTGAAMFFAIAGTLAVAAACALAFRREKRPITLTALWFVLPLGPPLATVSTPLSQNSVSIHYLYLPNVALAALVAMGVLAGLRHGVLRRFRTAAAVAGLVLCAGCGWVAHAHYQPWMSSLALWSRAVQDNPSSCIAHHNLGGAYWNRHEMDAARRHLLIGAYSCRPAESPERHGALIALAQFYMNEGSYARARAALREARALGGSRFWLGRGVEFEAALLLFEKMGPDAKAGGAEYRRDEIRAVLSTIEDAARIDPFSPAPRVSLGLLSLAAGERVRALIAFREALHLASTEETRTLATQQIAEIERAMAAETDPIRRSYDAGQLAESEGRTDEAVAAYEAAIAAAPQRSDILLALADVLARAGDFTGAAGRARAATVADPNSAIAWLNLGVYLGSSGDLEQAEPAFRKALDLAPGSAKACANDGLALEKLDRPGDALRTYESCLPRISVRDPNREPIERAAARLRGAQTVPG